MPEYTLEQVSPITQFLKAALIRNRNIEIEFDANKSISYRNRNINCIRLHYKIQSESDEFYIYILFFKQSGIIKLFSEGNKEIEISEFIKKQPLFTELYIHFETKKYDQILSALQELQFNNFQ